MHVAVKITTAFIRVNSMGFLITILFGVLKPGAFLSVGVSTAAGITVGSAGSYCCLSFFKGFLDSPATHQLHIEVSHEQNANIVQNHWILVYTDYHRNSRFEENLTNLLWVTRGDERHLDVFTITSNQILEPRLIELVKDTRTILFKLQVELFQILVIVSVAWNVHHFRASCKHLLKWLKI